jgi:cytochrome P450
LFSTAGKGGPFHKDWYDFLGNSVFTVDGQQWQDARRQLRPQFFKTRISDPIMFERHVQKVIGLIPTDGDTVDLASIFMRYTMDVATDLLLGKSTNSLENPDSVFIQAFAHIQKMQNILVRAG